MATTETTCSGTCACEPVSTQTFCTLPPLGALGKPVPQLGCGGYYLDPLRKLVNQWQGGIIQAASNPPRGSARPATTTQSSSGSNSAYSCCGKDSMRQDGFMTVMPYAGTPPGGAGFGSSARSQCAARVPTAAASRSAAVRIQSRPVAQPYISSGRCGSTQLQNPASLPGARLM